MKFSQGVEGCQLCQCGNNGELRCSYSGTIENVRNTAAGLQGDFSLRDALGETVVSQADLLRAAAPDRVLRTLGEAGCRKAALMAGQSARS